MKVSQQLVDFVKEIEGFKDRPYLCPAGVPTIGFGTTHYPDGRRVTLHDDPVAKDQAEAYLMHDLAESEEIVERAVTVTLDQGQFDAMVSIVYNVGHGRPGEKGKDGIVVLKSGQPSTLLRKLNIGDYEGAAEQFERWVFGGGQRLNGLVRRRKAEREFFEGKIK